MGQLSILCSGTSSNSSAHSIYLAFSDSTMQRVGDEYRFWVPRKLKEVGFTKHYRLQLRLGREW